MESNDRRGGPVSAPAAACVGVGGYLHSERASARIGNRLPVPHCTLQKYGRGVSVTPPTTPPGEDDFDGDDDDDDDDDSNDGGEDDFDDDDVDNYGYYDDTIDKGDDVDDGIGYTVSRSAALTLDNVHVICWESREMGRRRDETLLDRTFSQSVASRSRRRPRLRLIRLLRLQSR
ncbi:skeletal aspartic acid-rich protein 1-like [Schistocerca americana]|uniref:skeletal aspartic acid-rich protein 1-like n=1 Tax=Schistocerca americana TaxID=7009 RepID=UPI001F501F65|nr:skeletal aspartic acid-rich protein 1-like [Schistocerca americana]